MSSQVQHYHQRKPELSDTEKIVFHLQGREGFEELQPALLERLKRMQQCRDYMQIFASRFTVIPMLERDFLVSQSEAYRIFNEACEVFNLLAEPRGRDMWIDIILGKIFNTYQRATAAEDHKTALYCMKQAKEIIRDFYGDHEARTYDRIQPPVWIFGFFPELSKVPLPEDLDLQIEKLLKEKKRKSMSIEHLPEAPFIDDEPPSPDAGDAG